MAIHYKRGLKTGQRATATSFLFARFLWSNSNMKSVKSSADLTEDTGLSQRCNKNRKLNKRKKLKRQISVKHLAGLKPLKFKVSKRYY